jgi:mannosyltransferase
METTEAQATSLIPAVRLPAPRRDPWAEEAGDPTARAIGSHRAYRWPGLAWLIPGLLMGAVGAVRLDRPGLWTDEFATWGMTTVPWDEGLKVLRWVDAVIGPYYALMKAWTDVFGRSDLSLRIPSVIAMALAAALTGAIGNRVYGMRVGVLAGVVFAVLPGASRFAQEARPYAFAVLGAAVATYALVRILQGGRWWWFFAYAGGIALLGLAHVVALLVIAGHGWIILARRRDRTLAWAAAAVVGILPAAPLLWLGNDQKSQVAWIGSAVLTPQMFLEAGFGTVAAAAAFGALLLFSLPLRYPSSIFTAWAALPLVALLALAPFMPLLLPRYLVFTLPAFALLAGTALSRPHLALALVAIAGLVALSYPGHVEMREPAGHNNEATRELAALISDGYLPGDAIVYAQRDAAVGGGWVARDTVTHYVPVNRRPSDVYMTAPPRTGGSLLAVEACQTADCIGAPPPRFWVVRLGYLDDAVQGLGEEKETLLRTHYREQRTWRPTGFTVALVVRKTS